jgi:hypothetical protein
MAGGDVESNIDRWRGQVTDESGKRVEGEVTEQMVGNIRVLMWRGNGTYAAMGGSKQAHTAFRGAIIKSPTSLVFVRLTGPQDSIGPAESAWQQMVTGFTQ